MRQPLGDLDGADRLQRLRRRAGEQRDLAADDAAVVEGRREILLVAPVGDDPVAVAVAAERLQHAAELRPPRRVAAEELILLQLRRQVRVVAGIVGRVIRLRCRSPCVG